MLIAAILLFLGMGRLCWAQTFSGSVYAGDVVDTSHPLSGVTVCLYGSNNSTSLGVQIDKTSTDANGKYALDAGKVYEIYTIIEDDPAGYVSVGATSIDGKVIDENTIQYTQPLTGKELAKNNFWDKPEQQANRAPVADAGGPYSGYVGQWITFDGSNSYDLDQGDKVISWHWDMHGDGQYDDASGEIVTWKWDEPASGKVRLIVADTRNATGTAYADYSITDMFGDYDWGDAPSDPSRGYLYPTLRSANGARHRVDPRLCLGQRIDADNDGQPHLAALGDDLDADGDDEDGITFVTGMTPGQVVRLHAVVTNHLGGEQRVTIACWLDTNRDGRWQEPEERMGSWLLTVPPGVSTWPLSFRLPVDAVPGPTYARFRLFLRRPGGPAVYVVPTGQTEEGEVEDYMVEILEPQPIWDYGDAPDPTYPTLLASDGARHRVRAGLSLGRRIDAELDAVPHLMALGDDCDGIDDEDGVNFVGDLVPGRTTIVSFNVYNYTGEDQEVTVAGWIDFNRNGVWDRDELVVVAGPLIVHSGMPAAWVRMIHVPIDAALGRTYARFRLYRVERNSAGEIIAPGIIPTGDGGEGEVEDYALMIGEVIHSERLYEDPAWSAEGGWAFGVPLGGGGDTFGNPDPTSGYTGRSVYGVNLAGDYELTPGETHFLTAGPFDCTEYSEVTLCFARWLNSDARAAVWNAVHASGNGTVWHLVWQSPETTLVTDDEWQWVEYDISGIAPGRNNVYIRWAYQIKPGAKPYSGWNIDDVALWGIRNEPVHFVEPRLKVAVEGTLLLSDPTARDMLALTTLELEGAGIFNLTGLEYAINLQTLHLGDNLICDVRLLGGLVNLTELSLSTNSIVDVSPLAGLVNLRILCLGGNHIHDIGALAGLTQLTYLGLVRNFVEDISILEGMTHLEQAWLNLNRIVDIGPLENLTNLTTLTLDNNPLSDTSCRVIIPIIRANNPGIWLQSSCPP